MRHVLAALLLTDLVVLPGLPAALTQPAPTPKGQRLEALTWVEAERLLTRDAVVVIPLGAGSVEHGPHLPLQTDAILADYLARRVLDAAAVMVAPLLPYHYYPAFADYPGSTSLALQTARDLTTDVVRSLARSGPRRFYVLNTAIPATPALDLAASALAAEGILLRHTNVEGRLQSAAGATRRQEGGNHADEIETSMMLFIDPGRVSMSAATKDLAPASTPFRLARAPDPAATLSTTGIWGDPTLATAEKGGAIVESFVRGIVDDIQALQAAPLPAPSARTGPAATPVPSRPASERTGPTGRCLPGDERAIINIGNAFATHWANADAEKLGALWSRFGDMIHPDGMIERTSMAITMNRKDLFARREYRQTRHPLTLSRVRCLTDDVAVADGTWELRGVTTADGQPVPAMEGQCTLVLKRESGSWAIEAYRYTIK